MKRILQFSKLPWHAILFGFFPILALAAFNIHEINFRIVTRPIIVSMLLSFGILACLHLVLKDWQKAGLLTTSYSVLFYSYGHVYNILHPLVINDHALVRNRFLALFWIITTFLVSWFVIHYVKKKWLIPLTKVLNLTVILLIFFQIASVIRYSQKLASNGISDQRVFLQSSINKDPNESQDFPDIYYIILDAYGRSDVLARSYGIDNSEFLSQLRSLGFYIADCSLSNYAQTELSLASSLNMDYLQNLSEAFRLGQNDDAILISLIKNSIVRNALERMGYRTIAFATGYHWTEWENADTYYSPAGFWKINAFESLLIRSTAGLILIDSGLIQIDRDVAAAIRERTLFALDTLQTLPSQTGPKFVFAHLVIPHRPFVFGPNGETLLIGPLASESSYSQEEYREGYGNQIAFIDKKIVEVIKSILENSKNPPIIILQGDHGPGLSSNFDRMAILNAYYLPGISDELYNKISPVNTYRLIFNGYFDGGFTILEDKSYYSDYGSPYEFTLKKITCH